MNTIIDIPAPNEFGPHTDAVARVLKLLISGQLFHFTGSVSDRFLPIRTLSAAQQIAFHPAPTAFHWLEDRKTLWKEPKKSNVLATTDARVSYQSALDKLDSYVFQVLEEQIPDYMLEICFDEIYEDIIGIVRCLFSYGELDVIDQFVFDAYRQGGWPCGATGPRPDSESEEFGDRKIYVFWEEHGL